MTNTPPLGTMQLTLIAACWLTEALVIRPFAWLPGTTSSGPVSEA